MVKNLSDKPTRLFCSNCRMHVHSKIIKVPTFVGSVIYEYYCPNCGKEVTSQTPHQIAEKISRFAEMGWVSIFAPVITGKKGEHKGVIEEITREGWPQIRIDGILYPIEEAQNKTLDKNKFHNIEILVDRISLKDYKISKVDSKKKTRQERRALAKRNKKLRQILKEEKERILDSTKKALEIGRGRINVVWQEGNKTKEETFGKELKKAVFTIPIDREPKKLKLDYGFRPNKEAEVEDWFEIELEVSS